MQLRTSAYGIAFPLKPASYQYIMDLFSPTLYDNLPAPRARRLSCGLTIQKVPGLRAGVSDLVFIPILL